MPRCENCERTVAHAVFVSSEGVCIECSEYLEDLVRGKRCLVQVTRDMALDAGEPCMEGMWIEW